MKLVVFGLTISSSWGNGHATLWRSLAGGLARDHHRLVFFERDVPYYAQHRDSTSIPNGRLHVYAAWDAIAGDAARELEDADVAIVTSYCPDGRAASELVLRSGALRVFYDLDTPVTLAKLRAGERPPYLPDDGLARFDLVLSFTGGRALDALKNELGARAVAPLYGSVDPSVYSPVATQEELASDLSYLGTYSADRQRALDALFLDPADRLPQKRFLLGGSQYPPDFPWRSNVFYVHHVPPPAHAAFYSSAPMTLNVTREPMAHMGYCPSGRLFEAAACGAAILSDAWEGLDRFFTPGTEMLVAKNANHATRAMTLPREELAAIGQAARARALREHTGGHRARELVAILGDASAQRAVASRASRR